MTPLPLLKGDVSSLATHSHEKVKLEFYRVLTQSSVPTQINSFYQKLRS